MKKSTNRPQRLALAELDGALDSALQRVEEARELSQEECSGISGGYPSPPLIIGLIAQPRAPLFPVNDEI